MVSAAVVLEKAELPLAVVDLTGTLLVCVWKTVGLSLLPGWDAMFGPVGQGKVYPVRKYGEWPAWVGLAYLGLYGVLGSYAQYGSLQLALEEDEDKPADDATIHKAKAIGFFHTILAAHHLAWAVSKTWGRLDLSDYNLPFGKLAIGITSVWTGAIGLSLIKANKETSSKREIRQKKRLLDAASFISMIPTFAFLPANGFGYRNKAFETAAWATVPYGVLALLGWNAVTTAPAP